ncbi:MAG: hypothetical protein JRH20_09635 [Deltaproteobacteria bacterium]|nr:hypothetical protein [Deltaproteobacteria bacterium]
MKVWQQLCGLFFLSVFALSACSQKQWKFETLNKRDKLRYAACRHDVKRNFCPDDPDCTVKAANAYAKEPAHARLQWLVDYGCAKDKIVHAEKVNANAESKSMGMDEGK